MTDREKVIKGLECIAQQAQDGTCGGCAYFRPFTDDPDCGWCDKVAIGNDALALLRKQEPVEPTWRRGLVFCGKCGRQFGRGFKYCPDCGKKVKWDVKTD